MKYLFIGSQSERRFELLLSLTRINSDDVVAALYDHLVKGATESSAAIINGISMSNFNRAFKKLNDVAEAVEHIKEIDFRKLNQLSDNK
ncbi:adhesin biosynthesis transcription regulatory family protein [Idiomarina aminovorans]|uniref:adhesin biosynthesis transcription regulatory family protein n=1 Tax=Idiomarina aminovorans TaxID=2914829 RepID=UPI00200657EC|nr:adhesin biosynthesis transcription regulatory family protein [Idiomarina sp. ATCH4]MCK7458465.1 adhesin biosynthesis transcription regulatory family protein [Idiomarina sp. ATCH4]